MNECGVWVRDAMEGDLCFDPYDETADDGRFASIDVNQVGLNQTDSSSWNWTCFQVHLQRMRYTLRTQILMCVCLMKLHFHTNDIAL